MGDAWDMIAAGLDPSMTSSFEERDCYLDLRDPIEDPNIYDNYKDALLALKEISNSKAFLRRHGVNKYKVHVPPYEPLEEDTAAFEAAVDILIQDIVDDVLCGLDEKNSKKS